MDYNSIYYHMLNNYHTHKHNKSLPLFFHIVGNVLSLRKSRLHHLLVNIRPYYHTLTLLKNMISGPRLVFDTTHLNLNLLFSCQNMGLWAVYQKVVFVSFKSIDGIGPSSPDYQSRIIATIRNRQNRPLR